MSARHDRAIAAIMDTPPIRPSDDGLVLFSMMGRAVMLPYLVAVKSLWHHLRRGRVVIMDDGTLTDADRALLAQHCGNPEIIPIASVERGPFPKGGTWERFLTILDRRRNEYWIQLDSDTVTLGPVPEIAQAVADNCSFALPGCEKGTIGALPVAEIAHRLYPAGPEDGHVQTRIESRLNTISPQRNWRYIRGCSGFAGFAAGGAGRPLAAEFLAEMERMVGREDTHIWGTEQIASNFQLANESELLALPYDRYLNYWDKPWQEQAAFVHFVGTHRYTRGAYRRASQKAIKLMQAPA